MSLQLLHDWLLVKLDPLVEATAAGLALPPDSSETRVRTGIVTQIGPGKRVWSDALEKEVLEPLDVAVGEKVAFFRENFEHTQGRLLLQAVQELEEGMGVLRVSDILYVIEEGP